MSVRLKCLSPRPMASLRLLCLPFAGAGASVFRGWPEALPPHVELFAVQLPGREERLREPAYTQWDTMLDALSAAIADLPPLPTALFGHSLGGLAGYELARRMQCEGSVPLVHVIVSARPWPGDADSAPPALCNASDDALLVGMVERFGALPPSLAHPEIRDLALPVLRADLRLLEDHRHRPGPALACPLTVFAGSQDPSTPRDRLEGWRGGTDAAFAIEDFDAGHFFLESHRREVLAAIGARLPSPARW